MFNNIYKHKKIIFSFYLEVRMFIEHEHTKSITINIYNNSFVLFFSLKDRVKSLITLTNMHKNIWNVDFVMSTKLFL